MFSCSYEWEGSIEEDTEYLMVSYACTLYTLIKTNNTVTVLVLLLYITDY